MTGLEKIIEQIRKEAGEAAAGILRSAEEQAAAIREEAEASCRAAEKAAEENGRREAEALLKKRRSAAEMKKKKELLAFRQEQMELVLRKARQSLRRLDEKTYFELLYRLAEPHVGSGRGRLLLSPEDRERLPRDFVKRLQKLAEGRGGSLEVADETRSIDGGCLLIYGGIEENCSFEAIFREAESRLKDRLREVLFAEEEEMAHEK